MGVWKTTAVVVAAVLVGAVAAGAGVYLWEDRRVDDLRDRARVAEDDRERLRSKLSTLESPGSGQQPPSDQLPAEETTPPSGEDEVRPQPLKTESVLAFVKEVSATEGRYTMIADYAELLTGDDAVAAARADDSPLLDDDGTLPNDYYVRNRNAMLRTLPIAEDVQVQVVLEANPKTVSLSVWHGMMPGGADRPRAEQTAAPYRLTVKGGVVVRIEQQYLP